MSFTSYQYYWFTFSNDWPTCDTCKTHQLYYPWNIWMTVATWQALWVWFADIKDTTHHGPQKQVPKLIKVVSCTLLTGFLLLYYIIILSACHSHKMHLDHDSLRQESKGLEGKNGYLTVKRLEIGNCMQNLNLDALRGCLQTIWLYDCARFIYSLVFDIIRNLVL